MCAKTIQKSLALIATFVILGSSGLTKTNADPATGTADPAAASTTGPYTLSYKFVVGRTLKYSVTMNMNNQSASQGTTVPMNMMLNMLTTQTVQKVDSRSGNAVEKVSYSGMTGTINGQPLPDKTATTAPTSMLVTMSPTGQVIETANDEGLRTQQSLGTSNIFGMMSFLPKNPVNVGDTWTSSAPLKTLGVSINGQMTLKSVNVVDGDRIAKIMSNVSSSPIAGGASVSSPLGSMSPTFSGVVLTDFDMDKGTAIRTTGQIGMDISMNVQGMGDNGGASVQTHSNMNMQMVLESDTPPVN